VRALFERNQYLCLLTEILRHHGSYRTKQSRLLAEFRGIEAFAYESSDEDEEESQHDHTSGDNLTKERGKLPLEQYLENTVCQTGKLLVSASQEQARQTGFTPSIHLRLTRLVSGSEAEVIDERIRYTLDYLRDLGINLELGPNHSVLSPPAAKSTFNLPNNINLDLSLLIALVTDITHVELPPTPEDSYKRYQPQTDRSWKRRAEKDPLITQDAVEHCRALAEQTIDEMDRGLIERIHGRLANVERVQFWTTNEAKERFLAIIDKIGGEDEVNRAHALFSTEPNATESFWRNSRIPLGNRPPLIPISTFPSDKPDVSISAPIQDKTFNQMLITTCLTILSRPVRPDTKGDDPNKKLPAPTRFAARLSAHTIQSLLWGAAQKMVTLTSNKTSVRLVLREMRGFALPSAVKDEPETLDLDEDEELWSLWVMEPRSLAAVMRSDLVVNEDVD
jgi:hypothetical protein